MLTRYFRLPSISQLRFLVQTVHIEEEYYEEIDYLSNCPKGPEKKKIQQTLEFNKPSSLAEGVDFVGTIVGALHDQRAKDVLVMKTEEKEMTPYTHKIVCSAFNSRQAAAISENLRTLLKMDAFSNGSLSHVKKSTKRSNGWYVSDINQIQVHIMSEDCREKYDLETIWAGDDCILEEIEKEKRRIFLPPIRS